MRAQDEYELLQTIFSSVSRVEREKLHSSKNATFFQFHFLLDLSPQLEFTFSESPVNPSSPTCTQVSFHYGFLKHCVSGAVRVI